MKRTVFFMVIFIAVVIKSWAQENYHTTALENGLKILIIEDHSLPLVHIEMAFKSGGFVETSETDGLSHLYEHMIFNATEGYPTAKAFNDEILKYGILTNAGTDQELVDYFFTLPSINFIRGMELFAQGILHPFFLEEEFENEKKIVNNEFQRYESDPLFLLDRKTDHKLWGRHFSRKNVIGDHEVILSAQKEQLQALKTRYYHPNNALLIIAGDIKKESAMAVARENFQDWQTSTTDPHQSYAIPKFEAMEQPEHFAMLDENTEAPIVLYSWQGPDTQNDLTGLFAAEVLCQMLNLKNSSMHQKLVETNLVYEFEARVTFSRYTSSLYIEAYPNEKKLAEAVRAIDEEINRWSVTDYFTHDQIKAAIKRIQITEAYSQEELSEYIHELSYRWSAGDLLTPTEYLRGISKVTLSDINALISHYIINQNKSVGLISAPQLRKQIKKIGWKIEN
ncbi:MAG: pitrilysin family protein [Cyclobacteriaceae bacterium]